MGRALLLLALAQVVACFRAPAGGAGLGSCIRDTPLARPRGRSQLLREARRSPGPLQLAAASPALDPDVFVKQSEVLAALSMVEDPSRGATVTSLGAVKALEIDKDTGAVSFQLELGAPDLKGETKQKSEEFVAALPWVKSVSATMVAMAPQEETRAASAAAATGLRDVKNVVLVASCKGGVGKSTTAVNLAYSLHAQGHKVGILDVDIYGPSLPTMVTPARAFSPSEDIVGNAITPIDGHGVKLMSMGFINPVDSFVLRGAKVTPLVQQLISTTEWGELDYLIVDMPPGTGDIHLTLAQMDGLRIDAAVIVTTPQRLSFVDVVKGVEMFDKVGIPSVAVVENMAYLEPGSTAGVAAPGGEDEGGDRIAAFMRKYDLPDEARGELAELVGGGRQYLFGEGHRQRLLDMWGIVNSFSIPLDPSIARQGDAGVPLVKAYPESAAAGLFSQLAKAVVSEVDTLKEQGDAMPQLAFDRATNEFIVNGSQRLTAVALRRLCRSPANNPEAIPPGIAPTDWVPLGRYAVSINWSDGHQSLMPYRSFVDGYK